MINLRDILGKIGGAGRNLASGAKDVLIGTLRNMSPAAVGDRYRAVDEARRNTNLDTIRQALGPGATPESIDRFVHQYDGDPLFRSPYAGLGSFVDRLVKARSMGQ